MEYMLKQRGFSALLPALNLVGGKLSDGDSSYTIPYFSYI